MPFQQPCYFPFIAKTSQGVIYNHCSQFFILSLSHSSQVQETISFVPTTVLKLLIKVTNDLHILNLWLIFSPNFISWSYSICHLTLSFFFDTLSLLERKPCFFSLVRCFFFNFDSLISPHIPDL